MEQVAACLTTLEHHKVSKTAFLQAASMVEQALVSTRQLQLCSSITDGSHFSAKPPPARLDQQQLENAMMQSGGPESPAYDHLHKVDLLVFCQTLADCIQAGSVDFVARLPEGKTAHITCHTLHPA